MAKKKLSGAGDLVGAIIEKTGLKPSKDCGCEKRKEWLNKKIPFINKTPNCMTEEQVAIYESFDDLYFSDTKGKSKILIPHEQMDVLMNLYNSVMNTNVKRCDGCQMNIYWDRLTEVYRKLQKEQK